MSTSFAMYICMSFTAQTDELRCMCCMVGLRRGSVYMASSPHQDSNDADSPEKMTFLISHEESVK